MSATQPVARAKFAEVVDPTLSLTFAERAAQKPWLNGPHRAFLFDFAAYEAELGVLLNAALADNDAGALEVWVAKNRNRLKSPYTGALLDDDWTRELTRTDIGDFASFGLTAFYEPDSRRGLGNGKNLAYRALIAAGTPPAQADVFVNGQDFVSGNGHASFVPVAAKSVTLLPPTRVEEALNAYQTAAKLWSSGKLVGAFDGTDPAMVANVGRYLEEMIAVLEEARSQHVGVIFFDGDGNAPA